MTCTYPQCRETSAVGCQGWCSKSRQEEYGEPRADLCADPALLAEAVEVLGTADDALTEVEAILGGEYGDLYGPLCETMLKLRSQIEDLREKMEQQK